MRDPEMVFAFHDWGTFQTAEPISYRNDYMGVDQECYIYDRDGKRLQVRPDLKVQFKSFAQTWLRNLRAQGFFGPDARREPIAWRDSRSGGLPGSPDCRPRTIFRIYRKR